MHINVLWMEPIFAHSNFSNLYGPSTQLNIEPSLGTARQLHQLMNTAKQDGIHVVFDLVPHGLPLDSPLVSSHPQWVIRTRTGALGQAWGEYALNYFSPGWENYMRCVAEYWSAHYGVAGARIDIGNGSSAAANWAAGNERPSNSDLAGGLMMEQSIRQRVKQVSSL